MVVLVIVTHLKCRGDEGLFVAGLLVSLCGTVHSNLQMLFLVSVTCGMYIASEIHF